MKSLNDLDDWYFLKRCFAILSKSYIIQPYTSFTFYPVFALTSIKDTPPIDLRKDYPYYLGTFLESSRSSLVATIKNKVS